VNTDERQEIAASVAAHAELGPRYEAAVAEGLVERIGEEIDKRVDARLRGAGHPAMPQPMLRRPGPPQAMPPQALPPYAMPPQPTPPQAPLALPVSPGPARRGSGAAFAGMILALGSMGLGAGVTAVIAHGLRSAPAQAFTILLVWVAIVVINAVHSRSYRHHE